MTAERVALLDLTRGELIELMASWGHPPFRADQLWHWLYQRLEVTPEAMANLPAQLRAQLRAQAEIQPLRAVAEESSADGHTRKVLHSLPDGAAIESVLMGYFERHTACISTQAGCAMGCIFCATGQGGLERNLSPGEIVAQVLHFARLLKQSKKDHKAERMTHALTNVVLMGMGEPLANYDSTWRAITTLVDPDGFNLGARRITLSTVGLVPGIRRLAKERLPVNLAVSLHAADDALRDQLVPANRRYPLSELMAAIEEYVAMTRRRVTFEYALILGVNDAPEQARRLAGLLKGGLFHVNLIPLNPTPGSHLQPSPREAVELFRQQLEIAGIPVTVRLRRGIEIQAGCGQLRRRHA